MHWNSMKREREPDRERENVRETSKEPWKKDRPPHVCIHTMGHRELMGMLFLIGFIVIHCNTSAYTYGCVVVYGILDGCRYSYWQWLPLIHFTLIAILKLLFLNNKAPRSHIRRSIKNCMKAVLTNELTAKRRKNSLIISRGKRERGWLSVGRK